MTLNLAETSVVKSRPSVPYGANLLLLLIVVVVVVLLLSNMHYLLLYRIVHYLNDVGNIDICRRAVSDIHRAAVCYHRVLQCLPWCFVRRRCIAGQQRQHRSAMMVWNARRNSTLKTAYSTGLTVELA